jgi:hypothetical protein
MFHGNLPLSTRIAFGWSSILGLDCSPGVKSHGQPLTSNNRVMAIKICVLMVQALIHSETNKIAS